ncbi:hypothetical protein H6P81_014763 [Aristolochia fimbriata]|uniref:Uncharacterized protein n=1 Tax=Aristolochia fimbriata TaxID=158543 RepID=A0AAV7E3K2_ARIFI|nr:hypothetical protein H6P81_014763 [Aristolochia fimbriata]
MSPCLSHLRPKLLILLFLLITSCTAESFNGCFSSIISFGDSLADTGNYIYTHPRHKSNSFPYGETYFRRPTGRSSDGRLVIDFIAEAFGIPLVPPFLPKNGDFSRGVNFAVTGSTALPSGFFDERGIVLSVTNISLGDQLQWFKQLLPSLCPASSDCRNVFRRTLFVVGEIGGNDLNYPFGQGWGGIDQVRSFLPQIVFTIKSAVEMLIEHGATSLVVPGNLPIGCSPSYLANPMNNSPGEDDRDSKTGCLNHFNAFAEEFNQQLRKELDRLRARHRVNIVYADYYNAAMRVFRSPHRFGFDEALKACCGGGGQYNYNVSVSCGSVGAQVCKDPSLFVNWDGIHLTEAMYRSIAEALLKGPYTYPSISSMCHPPPTPFTTM